MLKSNVTIQIISNGLFDVKYEYVTLIILLEDFY